MSSGRIVAELGRPETPEETAERKARDSRLYRERKTLSNLIYALIATLAAVVVIVLAVPRPDQPIERTVDAVSIAEKVAVSLGTVALVPDVAGTVTAAELRGGTDGITAWYVGWHTAGNEYLGFLQAVDANASWVSNELGDIAPTGTLTLDGLNWTLFNNRDSSSTVGNVDFGMSTQFTAADGTAQTIVLFGTAGEPEFMAAATAVAQSVRGVS